MTIKHLISPDYRFSESDVCPRQIKEYWVDMVCDQYVNIDCEFESSKFRGEIAFVDLDGVNLSEAISTPQTLRRQAKHIGRSSEDNFFINLNLQGSSEFAVCSEQYIVNQGDCILTDNSNSGVWDCYTDLRFLIVQVPRSRLLEHVSADQLEFSNALVSGKLARSRILAEFIQIAAMASSDSELGINGRKKLSSHLVTAFSELIIASQGGHRRLPSEISQVVLKSRADKMIKSNLTNPNLGPELVAAKLNISKRYLYKLYQDSPISLWQTVKRQRLQKIAEILTNSEYFKFGDLTGLAHEFGFTDLSHLSRSFKSSSVYHRLFSDKKRVMKSQNNFTYSQHSLYLAPV